MRCSPTPIMVVTLLAGATIALAGEVTIAPLVGFSTGLIVEDLQTAATNSLEPGPVYGLIAGFSLGPERWIEVLWLHQDMEFCDECIPEEPDSFGLDIDSLHLGGVYRPGTKDIRPYAAASAGLTLYRAEAAGQGTTAGFSFALGGGIDFLLNDWMSVRLDGRGWLTFASGTLYGGCSGGCSIGFSGAGNFQIQLFAALVIRIP